MGTFEVCLLHPQKRSENYLSLSRSPSPRPSENKARSGYGVTTQELEYESNEEDEEEDEFDEEDMDEHSEDERMSDSSGRASSPAPSIPPQSPPPEKSNATPDTLTVYFRGDDLPESHERSTKDSFKHLHDVVRERYGLKAKKLKELIDREFEAHAAEFSEKGDCPPLRTSTIHSLVNNTHTESTSKSIRVIDLVGDDEDEDAIDVIEPAAFRSSKSSTEKSDSRNLGSVEVIECLSDAEDEEEDEEDDEQMFPGSDDDDHESVEEEEEDDMDDEVNDSIQQSSNAPESKASTKITEDAATSEPSSPPDVMSSRAPNMWPASERMGSFIPVREGEFDYHSKFLSQLN